jgi:hypothetical protein
MVVAENFSWDYLIPSSTVNSSWTQLGFNTTGWSSGNGGFGYGDGDDNTILPNGTISCYQRIEFVVTDTSAINLAALTIDYDDSFVAYLNGTEITRELLTGTPPSWNQLADGLHEADIYQGDYPAQYTILKSFLSANLNEGANVLAIETHNESGTSSDMTSRVFLHFGINNSSSDYNPIPGWFVPPVVFESSNLPIVIINTVNNVSIPNEPKVAALMGIIDNGEGNLNYMTDSFNEFYGQIGIEIRGSSSATFPKKAYGLETWGPDSSNYNTSIFNWPSDNDWVLYAPYSDKSLIRNVLTYKLGTEMGRYAPRTKLCEVVLNGEYIGVYVFTEKIKQNPGRVNVDKLDFADTTGNELTGGYVIKIDKTTSGGIISWTSPYTAAAPATGPIRYQLHDPDEVEIHPLQEAYIESYVTDFENALNGPDFADPVLGYTPYIDVGSFIDFMIVNEVSKNVDGYRISTFYHKQHISDGGKLVAGPLWDFNLGWGNADYCQGGLTDGWEIYFNDVCGGGGSLNNPFHWNKLVQDPNYTHALNCRWQELRTTVLHEDTLMNFIDNMELFLTDAAERNFIKWPTLGTYVWPNNFVGTSYSEEVNYLKTWIIDRLTWMDNNMFGSCADLSVESNEMILFSVFPNPTSSTVTIQLSQELSDGIIILSDLSGKTVIEKSINSQSSINLNTDKLSKGVYVLSISDNNQRIGQEKLIIQ